jgi:uncharacterized protein (TIGR04222 family)
MEPVMPLNPLAWPPQQFLILYAALLVGALLVSVVGPALRRPAGRPAEVRDPIELAVLAGGRGRVAEVEAARELVSGQLHMVGRDRFVPRVAGHPGLAAPEVGWRELSRRLASRAEAAEGRLRHAGLLVDDETLAAMRRWATVPLAVLAVFGTVRLVRGLLLDHPVGYLAALLVATTVLLAIRGVALDRRTAAGRAALKRARAAADRLRRAPRPGEMALGVALFGTAVLVGSEFERLHQLRAGDGGSSGSDGGGSDGGCGGGGCGGGGCGG